MPGPSADRLITGWLDFPRFAGDLSIWDSESLSGDWQPFLLAGEIGRLGWAALGAGQAPLACPFRLLRGRAEAHGSRVAEGHREATRSALDAGGARP